MKPTRHGRILAVALIMAYSMIIAKPGDARQSAPPDPLQTIQVTNDGLTIDWIAPVPKFERDPAGVLQVTIDGYPQSHIADHLQLPYTSILIALPALAQPELHIIANEESIHTLDAPLARAPRPQGVQRDAQDQPIGGAFVDAVDSDQADNTPVVRLERIGVMRGVDLARVTFYPVRQIDQYLHITSRLQVTIDFNRTSEIVNRQPESDDRLIQSIRSSVANPEQVEAPIQSPTSNFQPLISNSQSSSLTSIEVITRGLTALTYNALNNAGFPVASADPHLLQLTHHGQPIAAEWSGDNDTQFEPGERLLFYADPQFSRYTTTDTYFLSIENTAALRMSTRSANPAGLSLGIPSTDVQRESNVFYTPTCLCGSLPAGRDGDRWTWDVLRRPDRAQASYSAILPAARTLQPATLTLWLIGYTDVVNAPDHRIDVKLNGTTLGRIEWDGKQAITSTLPITPGILSSTNNTVTLNLPGLTGVSVEGAWLDAFQIHYALSNGNSGERVSFGGIAAQRAYTVGLQSTAGLRAYDISNPDQPLRLTNVSVSGNLVALSDPPGSSIHQYHMASNNGVLSPSLIRMVKPLNAVSGADYIIISPSQFMPALTPLINLRQSHGLSVVAEDLQSIYDVYGHGRAEPGAIHAYLQNAYDTWNPRPTYVLLVGDGTSDPKRYKSDSPATLLPPYLADVDPWAGETAADNRYVAVDGDDALPDLLLGRLPVNTISEIQIVVDKIIQYETQPYPGDWNKYIAFIADDPDSAGNFHTQSDNLAASFINTPFVAQPIYYGSPGNNVSTTRQLLFSRWVQGAGLIMYNGHSSVSQWAAERLLHVDDVATLNNTARLPIVIEMTCFTSSFHLPSYSTLDESLIRKQNGGAAAVWGATGLGVATGHDKLAQGFMQEVYIDAQPDLGIATLAGKLNLSTHGQDLDLIDTFMLLGDPALQLDLEIDPWPYADYLPIIRR